MATVALHSAASGLSALSQSLDVIANNLANSETIGFKASRVNFEDQVYQHKLQPGIRNAIGDQRPAGISIGLGTKISNTQLDFEQGSPQASPGDFDVMIEGPGFFRVVLPDNQGGGVGYTRAGNFFRNADGELVLGNRNGPRLDPPIDVPPDAIAIEVSQDGTISFLLPGDTDRTEGERLLLSTFVNPAGMQQVGNNVFIETEASGPAIDGFPTEDSLGRILHKFLETSNVDPVRELISLIKTQRAFEMNSQTIEAADQALSVISNLRRF